MYSLGVCFVRLESCVLLMPRQIVFFEMNYMFTTGAERIVVLENLRKPQIFFPAAWETHRMRQKQSEFSIWSPCVVVLTLLVITWLLQHDPAKRPTPVELSESPLMPPRVEDEQFKNTLGTIGMFEITLILI